MTIYRFAWVPCLCALALFPADAEAQEAREALEGDAGRGAGLYLDYNCHACHGYTGETGSGTRLNPPRLNQAGFIALVRAGVMGRRGPPAGSWMPPYAGEDVSDQDLADIFAWVNTLESNSPALEDIPLLGNGEP